MDKDALVMPQGPITRSRAKAIKDKLNVFMSNHFNKELGLALAKEQGEDFGEATDERGYTEKPMVLLLQANEA